MMSPKSHKHEVASFETNFFRIAGTSEAETSLSGKAECFKCHTGRQKSKPFGVTSFNKLTVSMFSFRGKKLGK